MIMLAKVDAAADRAAWNDSFATRFMQLLDDNDRPFALEIAEASDDAYNSGFEPDESAEEEYVCWCNNVE